LMLKPELQDCTTLKMPAIPKAIDC